MVLTVTEDTPADMLAGSMELLVHVPGEYHDHTQKVTVERSMAMMDLLVQIATAHKLAASSYTLQAIGEHGLVLPHQPNTPIGALDALEVKLLPKQGTFIPRKAKQSSQPFETTFRLQVHLPRNQLYVSRVSPKAKLADILDEVCREKNLSRNKYELRHPGNHNQTLDLSLSLQDYQLQEVTLYAKQGQSLGSALSSQDIMALQRQEERRRQQAKQGIFGFMFRKSKESSLSTDSLGGRSVSPARSDETGRSVSPLVPPPTRPQRKRRPAPNPPVRQSALQPQQHTNDNAVRPMQEESSKDKLVISHSRNSSDSSGYHEASVLSDNPDSAGRMPETLPRRSRPPGKFEARKLAQTSQASKSLCNLATCSGALSHAVSNTSLSSTGIRKKRAAPKPPISRPLSSAISTQALERIVDSEESLTSDMGVSKPPSDIAVSSETEANSKANSDIVVGSHAPNLVPKNFYHAKESATDTLCDDTNKRHSIAKLESHQIHLPPVEDKSAASVPIEEVKEVDSARVAPRGTENTDLLLQKVSTTLANVLPSSDASTQNMASDVATKPLEKNHEETGLDATPNLTINSQQDTSDYVSATEDLSTSEWQYQLPDPPSAFRDTTLPDHDDYDTITLQSVEVLKESTAVAEKNLPKKTHKAEDIKQPIPKTKNPDLANSEVSQSSSKRNSSVELRRDVISELETKIENGFLQQAVKKTSEDELKDESASIAAPKMISNTLPNFRITTYAGDKHINIYDTPEKSELYVDRRQERFLKSFATLSRNNTSMKIDNYTSVQKNGESNLRMDNGPITRTQSVQHIRSTDSEKFTNSMTKDMETVTVRKHEGNSNNSEDKNSVVHRSKSYIVLSPGSKYRGSKPLDDTTRQMIKSTSITNLNAETLKDDEKLLQYQESSPKNQNVHEKELQSVQVLKRILPQLTANKQAEEQTTLAISQNGHESNEKVFAMQPKQMLISSAIKPKPDQENVSKKSDTEDTVRYKYTGPPTVSISSWSERPSVSIVTTIDTDYKIGAIDNTTGAKTVVNLNGSMNDMSIKNDDSIKNIPKNHMKINHLDISNDNLNVKKMTNNSSACFNDTGFNNLSLVKLRSRAKNDEQDKPVVTNMPEKKYTEKPEFNDDDVKIDTRPVNFKELSQTFGKITLRSKSNYNSHNTLHHRNSDYIDRKDAAMEFTETFTKKNSAAIQSDISRVPSKKYTSIVGIDSQYSTNNLRNNFTSNTSKINGSITPVVRGFQIQSPGETIPGNKSSHVPAPPSMPVITGVTLKNNHSRPKSMPISEDPRDQLLASIRSFGRDKLKSINTIS